MILLTGFEPFGGLARNPSGDLARALAGPGVESVVLPVDYERIGPALDELLARPWDAVVLTGVAVGRSVVSLERVAINHRDAQRTDNAGATPGQPEVVAGGPAAYFSTLPLERMRSAVLGAGVGAEISLSAGAYLCNASFYLARHALDARGTPCGFVHLPPTPDLACGSATVPFDDLCAALRAAIDSI
ncbi:MAG: pyroglutamyl-peptidase I [Planctomycetota bacterium]|jgi:pyroglutamyl-peptidase